MRRMSMALAVLLLAGCASGGVEKPATRSVAVRTVAPTMEVENRSSQSFEVRAYTRAGVGYPLGTLRAHQTRRFVLPSRDAYISLRGRNGEVAHYQRHEVIFRRVED